MTEIVKINPADFGLTEETAKNIKAQFDPMLKKMEELEQEFNEVINLPIEEPATIKKAKELRLKYVKVRTGTADIHKTQKAFYLNGGRFVDGWKNAQIFASQGKEEKLEAIEKHYENLERERLEKLETGRKELLSQYTDIYPQALAHMEQAAFDNYLTGVKVAHEARIAAEKQAEQERIEAQRIERLAYENRIALLPYRDYVENFDALNFAEVSEEGRKQIIAFAKEAKAKIDAENARILKEKEAAEKKLAEERAKAEADRKAAEEAARKEREKLEAERAKLQSELQAKQEAERQAKLKAEKEEADRKAAEAKAAKAPDKEKLKVFVNAIQLPAEPVLQTAEHKAILNTIKAKHEAFLSWALTQIQNA